MSTNHTQTPKAPDTQDGLAPFHELNSVIAAMRSTFDARVVNVEYHEGFPPYTNRGGTDLTPLDSTVSIVSPPCSCFFLYR